MRELEINFPPADENIEGHSCVHWYDSETGKQHPREHKVTFFWGGRPGYGTVSGWLEPEKAREIAQRNGWSWWRHEGCGYGDPPLPPPSKIPRPTYE